MPEIEQFKNVAWGCVDNNKLSQYGDYFLTHYGSKQDINIAVLVINKSGKGRLDYPKYRMFDWFDVFTVCECGVLFDFEFFIVIEKYCNKNINGYYKNEIMVGNDAYCVFSGSELTACNINAIAGLLNKWNENLSLYNDKCENKTQGKHANLRCNNKVLYINNNSLKTVIITDIDLLDFYRSPELYSRQERQTYCKMQLNKAVSLFED